jgi:hypothetical protein
MAVAPVVVASTKCTKATVTRVFPLTSQGRFGPRAAPSIDADILVRVDVRLWVCRLVICCHSSVLCDTFCLLVVPLFADLTNVGQISINWQN